MKPQTVPPQLAPHLNDDGLLLRQEDIAQIQQYFSEHPDVDKMKYTCPVSQRVYPVFKVSDDTNTPRYVVKFKESRFAKPTGQGSFGKIWPAQDLTSGQIYALKLSHKTSFNFCDRGKLQESYRLDAEIWKMLNDNPLLDLIVSCQRKKLSKHPANKHLAVIPFRPEKQFYDWILDIKHPASLALALELCINLVKEVIKFHDKGFLHRDIKCENFLINETTHELILVDFGTVYDMRGKPSNGSFSDDAYYGTEDYSAPEICSTNTYSVKSEVYALGGAIAIVFGHVLYSGRLLHTYRFDFFYNLPPVCRDAMLVLLSSTIEHDPARRPTPLQMLATLNKILDDYIAFSGAQPTNPGLSGVAYAP